MYSLEVATIFVGERQIQYLDEYGLAVGYLTFRYASGRTCEIVDIKVETQHQRKGIGRILVDRLISIVTGKVGTIYLFCDSKNQAAINFYDKMEFSCEQLFFEFYPMGDAIFCMRKI